MQKGDGWGMVDGVGNRSLGKIRIGLAARSIGR